MESYIYLDHAATTRTLPGAVAAMLPYLNEQYGNASSMYGLSSQSRHIILETRETLAKSIGASSREIYFTSGGTEADNWALLSVAESLKEKGRHIITTRIEHHAILHTCEYLEKNGFRITYLNVDGEGRISPEDVENAIQKDTILISVMYANNEIGTIEPICEIGRIAHERGILFHTDAVQAYGHIRLNVEEEKLDLLSASAHKLGGPKGIGFLYIRNGVKIGSLIRGGGQERGRRAGTENVPAIAGFGAAVQQAFETLDERKEREEELRDYLIGRLQKEIEGCRLNGHQSRRLPGNVNISIYGVEGETMLIMLDRKKICASSGSACATGSIDPSHVLLAIGLDPKLAKGSLRLTLGAENTREEIDYTVDCIKEIVEKLRK